MFIHLNLQDMILFTDVWPEARANRAELGNYLIHAKSFGNEQLTTGNGLGTKEV